MRRSWWGDETIDVEKKRTLWYNADDIIFPNLAARMIELKESKEGVESMCQSMEKERIRTREEDKLEFPTISCNYS